MEVNFLPMYEGEGTFCDIVRFCGRFGYFLIGFYETNYVGNRFSCCDVCFASFPGQR